MKHQTAVTLQNFLPCFEKRLPNTIGDNCMKPKLYKAVCTQEGGGGGQNRPTNVRTYNVQSP